MNYHTLGKTGERLSILGFGIMRLTRDPEQPDRINRKLANEIVRYAIDHGVNYFDTAQNYSAGESESVLGEALRGRREQVKIATKVGLWHTRNGLPGIEAHLTSQLQRLETGHIDFYMIHALTDARWKVFKEIGLLDFLDRKKREGILRHVGFSYHGSPAFYQEVIGAWDWEFTQIQFNYVDRYIQAGEAGLVTAHRRGVDTIIMEPLRGGQLVREVHPAIRQVLHEANPDKTLAQWALEYLWNRPEVDLVLSGMTTMADVRENIALAEQAGVGMLTEQEVAALEKAGVIYQSLIRVPCTLCRYCEGCPQGIDIARIMRLYYNSATLDPVVARRQYQELVSQSKECIDCGMCEVVCPQDIRITEVFREAAAFFASDGT
ncbi:MAG: aldo/keto reductase [Desulfuromonadaceae bacterium]